MKNRLFLIMTAIFLTACGSEQTAISTLGNNNADIDTNIYYGDIQNNELLNIDLKTMKLVSTKQSSGDYPYEIANGYDDELLVINRKDTNIGIVKDDNLEKVVDLEFSPRSIALNKEKKLTLISSSSAPAERFLKKSSLLYSDSTYKKPISYGGETATGHPIWINDNYFLLLDRTENSIELYKVGSSIVISKLQTTSSVHHVVEKDGFYYGSLEGIRGKTSPGIIKFKLSYEKFTEVKEQLITGFDKNFKDFKSNTWGFHHFAFHPDGKHIYVGSYEGNVFVLDSKDLSFVDNFKAGIGAGHFLFFNDTLIVTNHYDTFKSFYDVKNPKNNTLIKNLYFSKERAEGKIIQSHTSHVVDGFLYFTFNSNQKSTFYKVSLSSFSISDFIEFPNRYCVMGALKSRVNSAFSDM